jgi:hypothetical protein
MQEVLATLFEGYPDNLTPKSDLVIGIRDDPLQVRTSLLSALWACEMFVASDWQLPLSWLLALLLALSACLVALLLALGFCR